MDQKEEKKVMGLIESIKAFFHTLSSYLRNKDYQNLLFLTFIVIALGSVVFHYLEEWSWIDSVYFSVITLTTIGYGDFSPQTDAGKIFTIFYILLGVGIILNFIQTAYEHYTRMRKVHKQRRQKSDQNE